MITEHYEVHSVRNTSLHCTCWSTDGAPAAVLFVVHGLGEHAGRYKELASHFTDQHIIVFSFDHRGHGKSEGKRGHARSIDQFIEDVELVLMKCRSLYLELPIFMFGHSMGGQIVASYLDKMKSKEITGAILSSSWLRLARPPSSLLIGIAQRLSFVFPSLTLSNGISPKKISSVQEEVNEYRLDPLIHDKISVSLFHSLFRNGQKLLSGGKRSKIPVLVTHGTKDEITDASGSAEYTRLLGDQAEYVTWENSYHEPHHDLHKHNVIEYYTNWIKGRL